MKSGPSLFVLFFCALMQFGAPAASADTFHIAKRDVSERLNPSVDVSGSTRAGVMARGDGKPKSLSVLHFYLPRRYNHLLCVEISASSGIYEARFQLSLAGKAKGQHTIEFESRHALRAWYDSPDYQSILGLRLEAAPGHLIVAEGFVPPTE